MTGEQLIDARRKYYLHSKHCKNKKDANGDPVHMLLTFEQWLQVWMDSGMWGQRGRLKGQYVMCRLNDLGDYTVGNVRIALGTENLRECAARAVETRRKHSHLQPSELLEKHRADTRERMRRYRARLNEWAAGPQP